jgi:hypothetical protein
MITEPINYYPNYFNVIKQINKIKVHVLLTKLVKNIACRDDLEEKFNKIN